MENERNVLLSSHKDQGTAGTSSVTSASFNFINSIIGSGIIGLPYSLSQAGLPMGLLLLILVACITDYSIILLIRGGNLSGTHSYQSLVHHTFGQMGYLVVSALQFLYPFIAMISYNIITGDTMTKVFARIQGVESGNILTERHFVIMMSTLLCTLPLSLYKNIAKLGKVSLLSMFLTFLILITVVVRAATLGPQIPASGGAWVFARWNGIQAVAVMSFAFVCHHNSFLIYGSLSDPTLSRWSLVTHVSVGSAMVISAVFAAAGDIFENYCRNDNLATFGRFCFGLSIITTFPLECFVTREVISHVFFQGELGSSAHVIITVLIVSASTVISLSIDCLGIVLELNGVLSAVPLMFIFPAACFLKLSSGRWFQGGNLIPSLILSTGVCVMVIGLIMMMLFPQSCSHGAEMFYCSTLNSSSPSREIPMINTTQRASLF
ncbi:hypothetical protein DNTS_032371 [Danionella cerebrum]|uniref:Putative sodium-coupled neutral amino acid transporter 11 n=1 Tax=Danionella cerebrum TaxID=2873325 RepID=A0A553QUT0_9TELE|nr:hypothetical protein DNTS_032371 [Danionella translucida]